MLRTRVAHARPGRSARHARDGDARRWAFVFDYRCRKDVRLTPTEGFYKNVLLVSSISKVTSHASVFISIFGL